MALDEQQKKQALILLLLVGVLGVVFRFVDPLGLFHKDSEISPEMQKKVAEQAKKTKEELAAKKDINNPEIKTDAKKTDDKSATARPAAVDIHKTSMDYDELIPEVLTLDISKQFDAKTAYKTDILTDKIVKVGGDISGKPDIKISSFSSVNNVNKVKLLNVMDENGNSLNISLSKGDEFYFKNIQYRILEINVGYDTKTKSQVRVKIMDLNGKNTNLEEYTIYWP